MRIIVGKLKGLTIEAPRGVLSRPPLAIIRESVFNILADSVEGTRVLDLFAGSGSLGIEALSRGAGRAHFVDSSKRSVEMIGRNVEKLGISDACSITRLGSLDFVRSWHGQPFDLVFVDPPFLSGLIDDILGHLPASGVLSPGAVVVCRTHWREDPLIPEALSEVKRRKFGESVVRFLRNGEGTL
jgi:16S rRNA (guanine(966)-N(2))-methyltransferase RsmD